MPAGPSHILLVVAAPAELRALTSTPAPPWKALPLSDRADVLLSGVGKTNAAGAVARALDPDRHALVINLGIAGSLPGSNLSIGDAVIASASAFADEGVLTNDRFEDLAARGFPPWGGTGPAVPTHEGLSSTIARLIGDPVRRGIVATVSTCSGTDELAAEVMHRTAALAEAMEGAAVGASAHRLGVPFAEVRVISNNTGDRECQTWDFPTALARVGRIGAALIASAANLTGNLRG